MALEAETDHWLPTIVNIGFTYRWRSRHSRDGNGTTMTSNARMVRSRAPSPLFSCFLGLALARLRPRGARVLPSLNSRSPHAKAAAHRACHSTPNSRARVRASAKSISTRAICSMSKARTRTPRCHGSATGCTCRPAISTIENQLLFQAASHIAPACSRSRRASCATHATCAMRWCAAVAFHDGVVDVEVTTQEVWTFSPGVSFGRKGGNNTAGFEVEELNFLGTGTQLGTASSPDVDRDSKYLKYRDRQLGSSWWALSTPYSDNSDGRLGEFTLEQPFYSLDSRRAGGLALLDDQRTDSRYDLGEVDRSVATTKGSRLSTGEIRGPRGRLGADVSSRA